MQLGCPSAAEPSSRSASTTGAASLEAKSSAAASARSAALSAPGAIAPVTKSRSAATAAAGVIVACKSFAIGPGSPVAKLECAAPRIAANRNRGSCSSSCRDTAKCESGLTPSRSPPTTSTAGRPFPDSSSAPSAEPRRGAAPMRTSPSPHRPADAATTAAAASAPSAECPTHNSNSVDQILAASCGGAGQDQPVPQSSQYRHYRGWRWPSRRAGRAEQARFSGFRKLRDFAAHEAGLATLPRGGNPHRSSRQHTTSELTSSSINGW